MCIAEVVSDRAVAVGERNGIGAREREFLNPAGFRFFGYREASSRHREKILPARIGECRINLVAAQKDFPVRNAGLAKIPDPVMIEVVEFRSADVSEEP